MNPIQIKKLALDLVRADSESEVIQLLKDVGLWDKEGAWRLLGDDENNFRTVGAQQANSVPALVEKVVNSIDARLTAACIKAGVDPTSPDAPRTIRAARSQFFDSVTESDMAKEITLAVTGARPKEGMPCITICDTGEGQTPMDVPVTFMSIDKKNKLRIPFVQGKFNMGGTGALVFCGKNKLQLLLTRRDPGVLSEIASDDPRASDWSITVVRREIPPEGPGQVRNPYFKYLAPEGCEQAHGRGEVLSFHAESLDLMPLKNHPYARSMHWGSLLKMYDYDMRGFKGSSLQKGGLLRRLEACLPVVAHPIRVHECRVGLKGHGGSFDTNLVGLKDRLTRSRSNQLEPGYPASLTLNVQGQPMIAQIYAFKGNNADAYATNQGVIFSINGQNHGSFPRSFFERKRVKMGRLAKALMVIVDCTEISVDARADLFKNSRDRLSGGDLRRSIEDELENQIASHPGLRALQEERRRTEVAERLSDERPFEDVIRAIMKGSPALNKLFILGQRLSAPFRSGEGGEAGGGGFGNEKGEFHGEPHPTFFKFDKIADGETLERTCEHEKRCRIKFHTDVENEYFSRELDRGRFRAEVVEGALKGCELSGSLNLFNGVANWSVSIPGEDVEVGDKLTIQYSVSDDILLDPIVQIACVEVVSPTKKVTSSRGTRDERSSGKGKGGPTGGIQLPEIKRVKEVGWEERDFNENSVCTMIEDADVGYVFYVNVDNVCLKTEIKHSKADPLIVETKFIYASVIIGLALIHDDKQAAAQPPSHDGPQDQDEEVSLAKKIEQLTRALGPFLLPMIDYLGGLEEEAGLALAQIGDEE